MKNLISNSFNQLEKNGKIVITVFPDGVQDQNEYQLTCKTFQEAIQLIQNSFFGLHDKIIISVN
jgi:hypothetical protein